MLGREAIIDRQHARAGGRCDSPSEMPVKVRRADDEGSAMQEEDMALGYGRRGGYQIRPNPVGIDSEGPNVRRRVRNQPLGEGHKPAVLLDRELAVTAML